VTLEKVVIGEDEDGDDVTTLAVVSVEPVEPGEKPKPAGNVSKTERTRRAFVEAYHHLANEAEPTNGLDGKTKVRKVKVEDLRDRMRDCGMLDCYDSSVELLPAAKTLFSTVKAELIAPGKDRAFIEFKGLIWRLYPEQPLEF
jgi:hypothetical protein